MVCVISNFIIFDRIGRYNETVYKRQKFCIVIAPLLILFILMVLMYVEG